MALTPVSELSSTAEYEEECDMLGLTNSENGRKKDAKELESENTELRNLCGYLDQAYQKSRHVCLEWQSLGCYTAEVLKVEVASYKTQDRATKEQLEKLVKDNRELKEMCIFLDQSQGGSQDKSLTPPEVVSTMFHAGVVGKVNQQQGKVPQYPGLTKRTTLKDSHAIERGVFSEYSKEVALEQMRTRLKRLEAEKMELIKSLSAAHLLAADPCSSTENTSTPDVSRTHDISLPENLRRQWEKVRKIKDGEDNFTDPVVHSNKRAVSPDIIMNAVTLLDIVRRLEAATTRGFSDGVEEGEAVALRLLVNIAWQKMQENLSIYS